MNTTVVLLNDMGRWLVTQLGRMSVELAILAGIVLIVLYVLRVKSPVLRHLFLGLLLAKPVVTFLVASPLSLYGFFWPTMPEVFYTSAPTPVQMESTPFEPSVQTAFVPEVPPIKPSRPETPSFWRQIDRYGLISALWALVASLFGLRLLLGCAYVSFLRSTAITQREGPLAELVAEADGPLRMRRRVRIATTRVAHGPVLAGIFRPVILLPEHMAEALTPKQMKLVITHELAHAKRWDNLVLLIQRLAEMFFFFHPVVWFCGWMMRREAEAACDDMVVSAYGDADGAGAAAYADSLTRVAEMKCGITRRLLVNTFAAAESNFHRRIKRILSGRSGRMTLWLSLATGAALVLIGVLGLPTVTSAPSSDEEVNNLEKLLDQPGSIAFENQHVSEILEFISDSTDTINFAIDWRVVQLPPHVSSKANTRACGRIPVYVTDGMVPFIDVHNVLWREVLDTLLLPLGLTYVVKEHYVWISSLEMLQEDAADSISPPRNSDPGLMKALSDISNIEFEDISVREILDFISDSHNIRIVVDDAAVAPMEGASPADAATYVTNGFVPYLSLRGVPVSEALEALLRPLDLAAVVDGDTVRVIACHPAETAPGQIPPIAGEQEASDPPLAIEYLLRTPGNDGFVCTRIQAGTKKMWVKPGEGRDGYLVKNITLDPARVTVTRQADGREWTIPVDSTAIRDAIATDPVGSNTLKLLDIKRDLNGPRARIQIQEGSRGHWFYSGDSFEPYLFSDIKDQEGTALVTDGDGKSFLLKLESGQTSPDPAPQSETEAKKFLVPLKEDRIVELLAVRRHGSDDQSFWRPDGTPLVESPYDHVSPAVTADGTLYEFVFRIKGMDSDLPTEFNYDGLSGRVSAVPLAKDESVVPGMMVHTVVLKDNPESVTARLKFASAEWTPLLSHDNVASPVSGHSTDKYSVTFAEPYVKDTMVNVTLTFTGSLAKSALRLVAIDKSVQTHTGSLKDMRLEDIQTFQMEKPWETVLQNTYAFSDVKLEDIQSFQVETCPWDEVEFTNISLAAGRHTDCNVSAKATVKIPEEQIQTVTLNSESEIEHFLNAPRVEADSDKGALQVTSLDGTKIFQISALQNAPPISGPFRVAPLVGCLSEKIKQDCKAQGITDGPAIVKKLQEVTLEMMRKALDRASLQEVSLREGAHGRIIVEPPAGMDFKRVMPIFKVPGTVKFCPAASVEETLEALRNAEKDSRFQGRIEPLIDLNTRKGHVSIKPDQREAATEMLSELQSVLPENKFFLCGSRQDPNALYLIDFNTSMPTVKVRSAEAAPDENNPGQAMVLIMLADEDAQRLGELTQSLLGKSLAILVDSEIQMVPTVRDRITNGIQLVGNYTPEEATGLAARLSSPGYPVPLAFLPGPDETSEALEERTYENINEAVFEGIRTHLLPVYDPNTGEELSTLSYDKASGRLTIRNLPDNFSWFERLLSQLGLPKKIKISSASSQLASCANNLKHCGIILKMFENEAPKQMAPPLSPLPGCLMWRKEAVYPEYLTDPTILICPTQEEKLQQANGMEKPEDKAKFCFDNSSYWYLGYAIPDEKTGLSFVEAYKKQAQANLGFEADLKDDEGFPILRLREGVERAFITDIQNPAGAAMVQSELPIFIERPGHHDDKVNVVFLDGHVEWPTYPGDFPVSKRFIEALESLDALRKQGGESSGSENTRGKIIGVVTSSTTGQAISSAYVGVGDCGDSGGSNHDRHRQEGLYAQGKTDDAGQFTLDGLALGREHLLIVTHPDFVREDRLFFQDTADSGVPFMVSLKPAARITTIVVDAKDTPAGDAATGKYFFWLEALDGHKFIPPGRDPHLTSFASPIWSESGTGDTFSFSELDAGEYSVNVLREVPVAPTDEAMSAENTAVTVTYHGGITVGVENGQSKTITIAPVEYDTRVRIGIPNTPDIPATVQRILAITRDPAFTSPGETGVPKIYTFNDPLFAMFAQGVFYSTSLQGDLFVAKDRSHRFCTFANLPPGKYCVLGGAPAALAGALFEVVPNREEVIELGPNPGSREKSPAQPPYRKIDPQGGEVVDGLQAVLKTEKEQWAAGEIPQFTADLHNVGAGALGIDDPPVGVVTEYDGVQYTVSNAGMMSAPGLFSRGVHGIQGGLDRDLMDSEKRPLTLTPGKHTVRVAFHVHAPQGVEGAPALVFSNPVTIEMGGVAVPGSTATSAYLPLGMLLDLDQPTEGVQVGFPDVNRYKAIGDFRVDGTFPENKRLGLLLNLDAVKDLSFLTELPEDRIELLGLPFNDAHTALENSALSLITGLKGLKSLYLDYFSVPKESLPLLKNLPVLETLAIHPEPLDADAAALIAQLPTLKRLRIEYTDKEISSYVLLQLAKCTTLEELWIGGRALETSGLEALAKLPALRLLRIGPCEFDAQGLQHLAAFPVLRRLEFYDLSDEGMKHLPSIPSLKELDIQGKHDGFSPEAFAAVARMPGVESLAITGRHSDDCIAQLKPMTTLKSLGLHSLFQDEAKITDAVLAHLGSIPSLESLDIYTGNFTDAGWAALTSLPNLKHLYIPNAEITDAALIHIGKITNLEDLRIRASDITDEGLVHLESLTALKRLSFFLADKITQESIARLNGKLPSLTKIICDQSCFEKVNATSFAPETGIDTTAQAPATISVTADGQPASEAEVALARPGWWITCHNGKIRDAVDHRRPANAETYKTDSSGRLTLPDIQEPFLLVVTHSFGYALVRGKSPDAASIALTPWGAVEGQLQLSGVMCVNAGMAGTTSQYFDKNARAAAPSIGDNEEIQIMFESESRTDDNAHYVLSHLMAGKATVYPLIEDANGIGNYVMGLATDATIVSGAKTLLNFGQARFQVSGRLVSREGFAAIDWTGVKADLILTAPHIGMPGDEEQWKAQGAFAKSDKGRSYFRDVPIAADGSFHIDEVPEGSFFFRFYVPPAAAGMADTTSKSVGQGGKNFTLSAAAMKPGEPMFFDLGTFDVAINKDVTDTQKETAPPANTPMPAVTPLTAADALDNTMALAEFRLYVAHGAVTQKGNPLPDIWDKSFRPVLRGLLTSATEADAYAVNGVPLVMDGNTLTWAGKETPDPGCATLAASYSFMMRRDESVNQTISIPPEAGLPAVIPNEAEMKVACQLISEHQIRLWLTLPRPTEVSPEGINTWTNVSATALHDTWQLLVIDLQNEKNEPQAPLLLCWKFRYGREQDLKRITHPATVGNVAISQSPAPDMTHVPQYSTEAKILSGPVEAIERFVNTLETLGEVRVTPENTRMFRVADKNEIPALLETLEKQTPGLELLSAPRITMMSAEDMARVDGDKAPEMVGPPSQPDPLQDIFSSGQNRVVLKGSLPREFWQKNMGPYSASLVDFLQGEQYPGVIADMTTEYSSEPGVHEPVPTRSGIAVAVSLHKTNDPQIIDLRLYFNSKVPEPKGFFESPVTLATPFPLGQCIGFVTENPDPEKKTLVLFTLEQVNPGSRFFES